MKRASFLVILLLILIIVLVFNVTKQNHITALIAGGTNAVSGEEEYSEPVDIVWSGRVTAVMSGGSCIGVEGKFDKYSKFMACLSDVYSNKLQNYSGEVKITGKWLGVTCAYKNTIFGKCVPDVEIQEIH